MKSWMNEFKKEVSKRTEKIPLRQDVSDFAEPKIRSSSTEKPKKFNFKLLSCGLAAVVVITLSLLIVFNSSAGSQKNDFRACVAEINPAIAFILDDDYKVTEVKSLNGDADVIISDEKNLSALIGKDINTSISVYVDLATQTGFIKADEKENAVKLSGYGLTEDYLSELKNSLITALSEKGVYSVVLTDEIDLSAFKNLVGIDKDVKTEKIYETLINLPSIFSERGLDVIETEKLQTVYKEIVIAERGYSLFLEELTNNLAKLADNAELLLKITSNNFSIMTHADNPCLLFKDYWSVKTSGKNYEGEFLALMNETEELIKEYENEFGIKINSLTEYSEIVSDYTFLSDKYGSISSAVTKITKEDFYDNYELFVKILKNAGCDVSVFEKAFSLPETVEEFISGQKEILVKSLQAKLSANEEKYSAERTPLSQSDYDDYIKDIVDRYGSLENFWKNK